MITTWELLASLVSKSELNEVKSVLGAVVIDKLTELASEYSNLEEIALDIGPLPTNVVNRLKVKKIDERTRFVNGIRNLLNVDRIHEVQDDIMAVIIDESKCLEEDMTILYSFIEKQADRMMQGSCSDTKGSGLCCSCGAPKQITKEKKSSSTTLMTSSSSGAITSNSCTDFCTNCQLKRERRERKLSDKLPKTVMSHATSTEVAAPASNLEQIDVHNSKIRNKLQAAKDELYFLEEGL